MKPTKYQIRILSIGGNGENSTITGGIWVIRQEDDICSVVSSIPLDRSGASRFFLKSHSHEEPDREFQVLDEEVSGDWTVEPPPHLYQIKLL